tara:strand:+ start:54 stop:488 length:435 start_codon:yes stop_codon:yes gene_type:complete
MKKWGVFLLVLQSSTCQQIYNYYELALQKWCSDSYMIHGLWPQIDEDHYPTYCEEVEYNEPDEELLESMQQIWKGCDDSLWSHEWKKHGSCMKAQNNITENDFFNITMQLFDSYKFLLDINCNTKDDNCIMGCFDLEYNRLDEC